MKFLEKIFIIIFYKTLLFFKVNFEILNTLNYLKTKKFANIVIVKKDSFKEIWSFDDIFVAENFLFYTNIRF